MGALPTMSEMVAGHARLQPQRVAARDSKRTLSWAQWDERASRLANALLGLGLRQGDRVALLAYNTLEWLEIYTALARAGLVAVPLNFRLRGPEVAYIVGHCEAQAIIVQDALLEDNHDHLAPNCRCRPGRFVRLGGEGGRSGWLEYRRCSPGRQPPRRRPR
ncbi:MAG: AMP-binding protein [Rubrivivax sp.]|nr:AMP-binding protein [Rubrivivax sp.]